MNSEDNGLMDHLEDDILLEGLLLVKKSQVHITSSMRYVYI